jgi:hypothetical protein
VEVAAFMEVAAQRRDMGCLGQCERAVVHPVCIRTSGDHAYPPHSFLACAIGYTRKSFDQHRVNVLAVENCSGLDKAA